MINYKVKINKVVEVFKTNVCNQNTAKNTVKALHHRFTNYQANFDLEDCDRILRVESKNETLSVPQLLQFLDELGIKAEILPD